MRGIAVQNQNKNNCPKSETNTEWSKPRRIIPTHFLCSFECSLSTQMEQLSICGFDPGTARSSPPPPREDCILYSYLNKIWKLLVVIHRDLDNSVFVSLSRESWKLFCFDYVLYSLSLICWVAWPHPPAVRNQNIQRFLNETFETRWVVPHPFV